MGRAKEHAREAVRHVDEMLALYRDQILLPVGKSGAAALSQKANALVILGEYDAALDAADAAIRSNPEHAHAYYNAALALDKLGRFEEAALNCEKAMETGYDDEDLTPMIRALRRKAGTRR